MSLWAAGTCVHRTGARAASAAAPETPAGGAAVNDQALRDEWKRVEAWAATFTVDAVPRGTARRGGTLDRGRLGLRLAVRLTGSCRDDPEKRGRVGVPDGRR